MAAKKKTEAVVEPVVPPESEWTLNGNPIPEHLFGQVPFALTDQGAEFANRGKTKARVQVLSDEYDRNLMRVEDSIEPWEAANPIKAAIDRVRTPGMAYHLSSDRVVARNGLGKWLPCKDADGNLVKVGNMTLAAMPKPLFDRMERHYKDEANAALKDGINDFQVKQEQMLREAREQGFSSYGASPLAPGEMLTVGDSESPMSIGLHSSVGNSEF